MPKFLNTVFARDTTDCTAADTGGLQVAGGAYVAKRFRVAGQATFTDATDSTSTTSGAVTIPNGGLGVGGAVFATSFNGSGSGLTSIPPAALLAGGSDGQLLAKNGTSWSWTSPLSNPMTTLGDLIVGSTGGAPSRLAKGTDTHVLTMVSGNVQWAAPASGFTNPMNASGDMIYGGSGGAAQRLGKGTDGQFLTLAAGLPAWTALPSAGAAMLTTQTLANNTVNGVVFALPTAANPVVIVDFWATRGTANLMCGRITLTYDGTTARTALSIDQSIGTMGLSLSADVNGGNLRLLYTTTNTGTAVTMRYLLNQGAVYGQVASVRSVTSNTTLTEADQSVFADTTAGGFTITLPASPTAGLTYVIKKACVSANSLTIDGNGKAIDGSATLVSTATNRPSYTLQYDGVAWNII